MEKPDAGLRALDHYKNKLPSWRYKPRQWLIPLVRWETPYLAAFQETVRTPSLDSYFAITANLGTHTFFMIFLPILFWCGYTGFGKALVHLLASGVFFSGVVKDFLCLPRPLSPPLQRITMSGSAALEYGFPSTHSTNAVSVAVYAILCLRDPSTTLSPAVKTGFEALAYFYATSIVVGRIYCGMHGLFDVVIGSLLGAALAIIEFNYAGQLEAFIVEGHLTAVTIVVLIILVLVRTHPEPADDCPCFDDSVAFAGVVCGVEVGTWHYSQTEYAWNDHVLGTVPFSLKEMGWVIALARILIGVATIFTWREVMKPTLLKGLPPVFRVIERLGLALPRRFFKRATEYDAVPNHLQTDNVMPSVSRIPNFIASIRHPRRNRSVSVGPQSAADAYEAIAFRHKRRRESIGEAAATTSTDRRIFQTSENSEKLEPVRPPQLHPGASRPVGQIQLPTPSSSGLNLAGADGASQVVAQTPLTPNDSQLNLQAMERTPSQDRRQNEKEDQEMFSRIEKPRVRYDVEVVTKLIVYSGIAWIAVELNPILFEYIGLGLGSRGSPI